MTFRQPSEKKAHGESCPVSFDRKQSCIWSMFFCFSEASTYKSMCFFSERNESGCLILRCRTQNMLKRAWWSVGNDSAFRSLSKIVSIWLWLNTTKSPSIGCCPTKVSLEQIWLCLLLLCYLDLRFPEKMLHSHWRRELFLGTNSWRKGCVQNCTIVLDIFCYVWKDSSTHTVDVGVPKAEQL